MRRTIGSIGLLVGLALLSGCFNQVVPPDIPPVIPSSLELRSVVFAQVDWYESDGTTVQANSLYGLMIWTYDPDPTTTFYLNVKASLTLEDEGGWVIQNLPLFAVDNDDMSARREATYLNLAELGLVFDTTLKLVFGIDVAHLYVLVTVSSEILDDFPDPVVDLVEVETVEYWATGLPDESPEPGPFLDPGEPEGVKLDAKPEKVNVARDVRSVQEGNAKCAAGSFARSLDWLNRKHELGIERTAQQIYADLITAGVSRPNVDRTPARDEWVAKKNQYARQQSGNRIVTKVWDRGADVSPIPGVEEETGDFLEWLKREIQTEDVEVAYFYPGNAHIVTVLEVYTKDGDTYVKYRDDERQGDDTKGDSAVKHAKIYKKDGQYHFGSDRNTIYFAVSESVVPPPPGEIELPFEEE
ncbi:hypothetical protein KAJ02_13190 [Candidatus Bipolaricaulota bacterium]|nr:hypothetical protein [Candidatus Bipolaricaulota bacterium]